MSQYADILPRITPEDAADVDALFEASDYALNQVDDIRADMENLQGPYRTEHGRIYDRARFMISRLVQVRNDRLKELGAFRGWIN